MPIDWGMSREEIAYAAQRSFRFGGGSLFASWYNLSYIGELCLAVSKDSGRSINILPRRMEEANNGARLVHHQVLLICLVLRLWQV